MFRSRRNGFTYIETFIAMVILAVAALALTAVLRSFTGQILSETKGMDGAMAGSLMLKSLERDIYTANEFVVATSTSIQFICDFNRTPNYNPNALSVHNIPMCQDADVDGDAYKVVPATAQWGVGFNLQDDDDDGDNHIDMEVRYYVDHQKLYKDYSVNEQAWGQHVQLIGTGISSSTIFSFYGSKENPRGSLLDTGLDGVPGTNDAGENDGVITQQEIDGTTPANGGPGNRNGVLDVWQSGTTVYNELEYVTSVHIHLEVDSNHDGRPDWKVDSEVSPPMLPLKKL